MANDSEQAKLSAMVPTPLRDQLVRMAGEHDRSVSAEIRSAVRAYVVASPPQVPEGVVAPAAAPDGSLGES